MLSGIGVLTTAIKSPLVDETNRNFYSFYEDYYKNIEKYTNFRHTTFVLTIDGLIFLHKFINLRKLAYIYK